MKLLDFQCQLCDHVFEELMQSDDPQPRCPICCGGCQQLVSFSHHYLSLDLQTYDRSDIFVNKTKRWRTPKNVG